MNCCDAAGTDRRDTKMKIVKKAAILMMTAMLFVRPGDLYGRPIGFNIPSISPQLIAQSKELLNGSHN